MLDVYKILIVDDSAATYLLVAQILTGVGYRVNVALTGNEGIRKAFSEVPHCIILDIILPDISGFEVCRRLRVSDPNHQHPIILISSKNMPLDYSWGLKQGADCYLTKPFTAEALLQAVRYVLAPNFSPPRTVQQLIAGYQPAPSKFPPQPRLIDWTLFILTRKEESDLLTTDNPFDSVVVIKDRTARHVYDAIDGHKNVRDICNATGLSAKIVCEALHLLLEKGRVQMYKPDGTLADVSLLPNSH